MWFRHKFYDKKNTDIILTYGNSGCDIAMYSVEPFEEVLTAGILFFQYTDKQKIDMINKYINAYNQIICEYSEYGESANLNEFRPPSHY